MKKVVGFAFAGLFLLTATGCGSKNQVVCTGKAQENGMEVSMKMTATLKDDKVDKVSAVMTFSDEDTAKTFCSFMQLANSFAESDDDKIDYECNKKSISIKDYSKMSDSDDNKIIGLSKEDFIKQAEAQDLSCK